jgi:hypothetical protein
MSTISEAPATGRWTGAASKKASATWYLVALAVALVGVGLAGVWGVRSVHDASSRAGAFPSTAVPGTATVKVVDPGDQMIYFSGSGSPSLEALGLKVEDPRGVEVSTVPYDLALKVDLAGDVGTAIATFAADRQGTYTVTSTGHYLGGVIAVGDNVSMDVLPQVLGAVALLLFSIGAGIVIAVITLLRRSTTHAAKDTGSGLASWS